jgi:hypothetical protein
MKKILLMFLVIVSLGAVGSKAHGAQESLTFLQRLDVEGCTATNFPYFAVLGALAATGGLVLNDLEGRFIYDVRLDRPLVAYTTTPIIGAFILCLVQCW